MASYEVNAYGAEVKVRDPGMVVLFFFLTLGAFVYPQVWYYRINRELRDFGRVYRDEKLAESNPTLSVLASIGGLFAFLPVFLIIVGAESSPALVVLGVVLIVALIITPIVSYWRCTGRIRRAQGIAQEPLISGWIIFALYIGMLVFTLPGLGIPAYVQSALNGMWQKYPAADAGGQVATVSQPAPPITTETQ